LNQQLRPAARPQFNPAPDFRQHGPRFRFPAPINRPRVEPRAHLNEPQQQPDEVEIPQAAPQLDVVIRMRRSNRNRRAPERYTA
jgi:hypothetical protein